MDYFVDVLKVTEGDGCPESGEEGPVGDFPDRVAVVWLAFAGYVPAAADGDICPFRAMARVE